MSMIQDQYKPAINATLVDLREQLGGDRDKTAAFLLRAVTRFTGNEIAADILLRSLLAELKTTGTDPIAVPPAVSDVPAHCHCDLSLPLAEPPFGGEQLANAGNSQECPVYQGMDIRFSVQRGDDLKNRWAIASVFKDAIHRNDDDTVTIDCPTVDGYTYHVTGYNYNCSDPSKQIAGNTFKYRTTTTVFAECRYTRSVREMMT